MQVRIQVQVYRHTERNLCRFIPMSVLINVIIAVSSCCRLCRGALKVWRLIKNTDATEVVIKIVMTSPYSAMLKDRDYDVTPHIILILSLTLTQNARGVGERLRGVVWIWVIVGEECEVKMVGEVARG